jgi:hypothetical protein
LKVRVRDLIFESQDVAQQKLSKLCRTLHRQAKIIGTYGISPAIIEHNGGMRTAGGPQQHSYS